MVPTFAKRSAVVEIGVAGVSLALFWVCTDVFPVIDHLEITVLFHDPCHLVAHKRAQHCGGIFVVIVGGLDVADVVQQGGDDPVGVGPVAFGACGGLQ